MAMIIDIDNKEAVTYVVGKVTEPWFDVRRLYLDLKADGTTNSSSFWGITDDFLIPLSERLGVSLDSFVTTWNDQSSRNDVRVMGYHCTRHRDEEIFRVQGILPLSENTIEDFLSEFHVAFPSIDLSDEQHDEVCAAICQSDSWRYRSQQGVGPYFLLSYKNAKDPETNFFLKRGSEIRMFFIEHMLDYLRANRIAFDCRTRDECNHIILGNATPLIIHCAIPCDILPDDKYYIYCILKAYFNFIDPEDDENLFDGYSIDLKGRRLEPIHIVRVEEMKGAA